jgi:uncharacterized protein YcbK (DUF882 family)
VKKIAREGAPMTDQPKPTRRHLVIGLAAVAALVIAIPPALAARRQLGIRSLALNNLHTGERVNTVYWHDGKYIPEALRHINWVLRDHHTDEVCRINPELLDVLTQLQLKLRTREPFQIFSGYRSPATNTMLAAMTDGVAQNSLHMQGMAADIRVPDRSLVKVQRAALSLEAGGVGFYPRSDFVHVDIGRVRRW